MKENFDYDLFDSKIGYDSYNKLYLIRVYDLLVFEMKKSMCVNSIRLNVVWLKVRIGIGSYLMKIGVGLL